MLPQQQQRQQIKLLYVAHSAAAYEPQAGYSTPSMACRGTHSGVAPPGHPPHAASAGAGLAGSMLTACLCCGLAVGWQCNSCSTFMLPCLSCRHTDAFPHRMCVLRSCVSMCVGILCALCGVVVAQVTILWCKECGRYLQPPKHWVRAEPESKELLTFCTKRIKGLQVRGMRGVCVWGGGEMGVWEAGRGGGRCL